MKTLPKIFAMFCAVGLLCEYMTCGQGFVNLNFENAIITLDPSSPYYPNAVYASSAIPGWTATGFIGPTDILYNSASLGSPSVSILGVNGYPPDLDGNFSIYLYGGVAPPGASVSISQTAVVPALTESIQFEGQAGAGPLILTVGGQNISFVPLGTGPNYTLYGGDVSGFGGYSELLEFSAPEGYNGNNNWNIDNIVFSPNPVPEPATWTLLLCGAGLWGIGKKWRRR